MYFSQWFFYLNVMHLISKKMPDSGLLCFPLLQLYTGELPDIETIEKYQGIPHVVGLNLKFQRSPVFHSLSCCSV